MIKLIVSDLDGTLLNHAKRVEKTDRAALAQAEKAGIAICLASGRMDRELQLVMEEAGGCYHRISQNGAYVYTRDAKLLAAKSFEPGVARELYRMAQPYDLVGLICVGQTIYIPRRTEASARIEARMFEPFCERADIVDAIGPGLVPCKLSFFGEMARLTRMQAEMNARFSGRIDTYVSDVDCLDVMPSAVSKGAGLEVLIAELGIRPEEVACVGDSFNDVSMFALTPHSFAMAHSHPDVKRAAARVVRSVAEAVDWVLAHNQTVTARQ